jgi:hypothetical protein
VTLDYQSAPLLLSTRVVLQNGPGAACYWVERTHFRRCAIAFQYSIFEAKNCRPEPFAGTTCVQRLDLTMAGEGCGVMLLIVQGKIVVTGAWPSAKAGR